MTMMTFAARRLRNWSLLIVSLAVALVVFAAYGVTLHSVKFMTGWLLIAAVLVLTLLNLRKRFSFLPLLSASSWLQFHIYLGLFATAVFMIHTDWRLPTGYLETLLWLLFVLVALSGIFGIVITRAVPELQQQHGESLFLGRIPQYRVQLAEEVRDIIINTMKETRTRTLAKFYSAHLRRYFAAPRNIFRHLIGSSRHLNGLLREIELAERYLDTPGKEALTEIRQRVLQKDNLDYQFTFLMLLRGWLFIHVPATYGMILIAGAHLLLAYGYGMGSP